MALTQQKILKEIIEREKEIIHEQQKIEQNIVLEEKAFATSELNFFQRFFVKRAKKHTILFQLVIVLAIVLVWRGLWNIFDQTPIISSAIISLICGLFLLWLFNRFTDLN